VTPWQPSAINSWISWVPEALLMLDPSGTDGSQTARWRKADSNVRSRIDPLSGIRIGFRGER
jgi:hypothetical protein